ncbi:MAG: hypothetical protein FWF75_00075 [Propionibacteriaceae bacterium]|nr:hypothetical protein [Propionibacteriaceae bacterium]
MTDFETEFTQAQIDMVSEAVNYASGMANDIYIYFSTLIDILYTDTFFTQNSRVYPAHKLPGVDVSVVAQRTMVAALSDQLRKIRRSAIDSDHPIPREGWIHYHVGGSVDARYSYEDIAPGEDPMWNEKLDAWMAAVQQELDANGPK